MPKLNATLSVVALLASFIQPAHATVALDPNFSMFNCPFAAQNDPYGFDLVMNEVKALLKAKLDQQSKCQAPLNALQAKVSTISDYFSSVDSEKKNQIFANVYGAYRND